MAMFSDPQYSIEHRQAMPLLRKDLVQAVPSQVAVVYWNAAPLASHDPTTRTRGEGAGSPPPMLDVFLDPSNQELPSFNPGSLSPMLHAQLYPEGPAYSQRTGFGYRDQSSCTTHQELVPSPQITDPNLLVNDSRTTPTIPGTTVQWSSTTHIRISPAPTPDLPADFLTEYAEDVWRFLRKWGNRYECLRDGASGSLCGYSGSLTGIKRHLRSSHHLERSIFCPSCEKPFHNPYSLRLHKNQHTGEKPYKCQDCEMAFKNPNSRRNHKIRHHRYIPKKRRHEVTE